MGDDCSGIFFDYKELRKHIWHFTMKSGSWASAVLEICTYQNHSSISWKNSDYVGSRETKDNSAILFLGKMYSLIFYASGIFCHNHCKMPYVFSDHKIIHGFSEFYSRWFGENYIALSDWSLQIVFRNHNSLLLGINQYFSTLTF